jgi:zinc/manganese transport system permease protein
MNIGPIDLAIVGPALIAGLLVLATHVPLGMQVLSRGIVFIDLAVAQIAGLGVILADMAGWEPQRWQGQLAALVAAVAGALLLTWTEKRYPDVQEAIIGSFFMLAATGATLLLAGNPHGGEHLKDLLVGQILWVSTPQLVVMAVVTVLVLAVWRLSGRSFGVTRFYMLFAVSVTASVQLVGVYLVFASLILPALAIRGTGGPRLPIAYALGAAGYALGLVISSLTDWPSGPTIAWTLFVLGAPVFVWRRRMRAVSAPVKEAA